MDRWKHSVRLRLEGTTKAELAALKSEVQASMPTRPASCRIVLELASQFLQPHEKAHDDFAVRSLGSDSRVMERALLFGPAETEQLHPVMRQRIWKQLVLHDDAIAEQATRNDAAGALAAWLQLMHEALVERPNVR